MPPKYSPHYVSQLLAEPDYSRLVELSNIVCGWSGYQAEPPDYNLPEPIFTFVECLTWFAQSIRSGTWTYFEATPTSRQAAMHLALKQYAPQGFADHYEQGMQHWQDETKMAPLDVWIEHNDERANRWLWELVNQHRPALDPLLS
jgi:hypothetical protein